MSKDKLNLGVMASGTGSNLQAIIDACKDDTFPAQVSVVICDKEDALALEKAQNENIPAIKILRSKFKNKKEFETKIVEELNKHDVVLVCLAGFMRIVGKTLLDSFQNKIINIHPSLLPSFPGLNAQGQAFEYGVKVAGCTVHFVDDKVDHGPIIIQESVAVSDDDTRESLQKKILDKEHTIYPEAIRLYCENKLKISNRRVYISPESS